MAEAPAGGSASPRPLPIGLMAGTEAEGAEAGLPMGGAGGEAIGAPVPVPQKLFVRRKCSAAALPLLPRTHAPAPSPCFPRPQRAASPLATKSLVLSHIATGHMDEAEDAFTGVRSPDILLHNIMVPTRASLAAYRAMLVAGVLPTLPIVVKGCGRLGTLEEGRAAHEAVSKLSLGTDVYPSNSLISFYVKLGLVGVAERVFGGIPARDVIAWNTLMDWCVSNGMGTVALACFQERRKTHCKCGMTVLG
ncbi:pentatricopeptide repeat-containing protein At4g35130, chloroplastic [Setaria italica]|uniref:pentatricopeptide repeat-containing protein At4g35130, chloroplastic n=1 Tax=Setaria italica TaxID=4555 RepID=UPI0006464A7C|nr:pentatricopeptide repeat-containing protein At4g35130, chloroplastic [Setaria italica]